MPEKTLYPWEPYKGKKISVIPSNHLRWFVEKADPHRYTQELIAAEEELDRRDAGENSGHNYE